MGANRFYNSEPDQVYLSKQIYLMEDRLSEIDTVFCGEAVRISVTLFNASNNVLNEVKLAFKAEDALCLCLSEIEVYKNGQRLALNKDYRHAEVKGCLKKLPQYVTIQCREGIYPGDKVSLVIDGKAKAEKGSCMIQNIGEASFRIENSCEISHMITDTNRLKLVAPQLRLKKTGNTSEVTPGEYVQYTFEVYNTGNCLLEDILLNDRYVNIYLEDNVMILDQEYGIRVDGIKVSEKLPVNIGSMEPGDKKQIVLRVLIIEKPKGMECIFNQGSAVAAPICICRPKVSDKYNCVIAKAISNMDKIAFIHPEIEAVKELKQQYVEQGDRLDYSIKVINTGDKDITALTLRDDLPEGTDKRVDVTTSDLSGTQVYDRFTNVDLSMPLQIAGEGTSIEEIKPGEGIMATFSTKVNRIVSSEIVNAAELCYTYEIETDEGLRPVEKCMTTDPVKADTIIRGLSAVKSVHPEIVNAGGTAEYTIELSNTGNVELTDINLTDPLDPALVLVNDYTLVNGKKVYEQIDSSEGVTIDSLMSGEKATVSFAVRYATVPPFQVSNITEYSYSYIKDPDSPPIQITGLKTNEAVLEAVIPKVGMSIVKSSLDKTFVTDGVITYILKVENTGDVEISNIFIKDILPQGLTLAEDTVSIDGEVISGDITEGIILPRSIAAGADPISIAFQAIVSEVPASQKFDNVAEGTFDYYINGEKNTATVQSNVYTNHFAEIDAVKEADQQSVRIGDPVKYTIEVTNTGASHLTGVALSDAADPRLAVDQNSVKIDGIKTKYSIDHIVLPDLAPGQKTVITYSGKVMEQGDGTTLSNTAVTTGITEDAKKVSGATNSNLNFLAQPENNLSVIKTVSNTQATTSDTLTYHITMYNASGETLTGIVLKDILPEGLSLLPNSLLVDGQHFAGNLANLPLPDLDAENTMIVSFMAGISCNTVNSPIVNSASVNYVFNGEDQTAVTNETVTELIQDAQYYNTPVSFNLKGESSGISQVNNVCTKLINVMPLCSLEGIILEITYAVKIAYKNLRGSCRTYSCEKKTNIQLPGTYHNDQVMLWIKDIKINGCSKVEGILYIKVCR